MATNFARATQGKKFAKETVIFISKFKKNITKNILNFYQELSPHDIQRFAFTGVGRHPDSMNAILE